MAAITADQAKEIAQSFLQTYYQYFDNGPRDNLTALYVCPLLSQFSKF